jgi:endonuclease/exonuclease/phosphatase family metal-dependent hydrolase
LLPLPLAPTLEGCPNREPTANFAHNVSFRIGNTGQSVTIPRGWGSVDAKVDDGTFRFINTHLEPESLINPLVNEIQVAQGNEILSGPANTDLPVIMAGDYNSRADGTGTQTYSNLIKAGFSDAWTTTHPGELGNTWGHAEDLRNDTVRLTQRLDLVLFRDGTREDGLCAVDADIVGDELSDRISIPDPTKPAGPPLLLWPSDHAGVVATLRRVE